MYDIHLQLSSEFSIGGSAQTEEIDSILLVLPSPDAPEKDKPLRTQNFQPTAHSLTYISAEHFGSLQCKNSEVSHGLASGSLESTGNWRCPSQSAQTLNTTIFAVSLPSVHTITRKMSFTETWLASDKSNPSPAPNTARAGARAGKRNTVQDEAP